MSSAFEFYVTSGILANNEFGIREVNNLESVWSGYFEQERYKEVVRLIKEGKIDQITEIFSISQGTFSEYLDIMKFIDQHQRIFIVTVYDSNELMQNPQIIEIFKS